MKDIDLALAKYKKDINLALNNHNPNILRVSKTVVKDYYERMLWWLRENFCWVMENEDMLREGEECQMQREKVIEKDLVLWLFRLAFGVWRFSFFFFFSGA